MDKIHPAVRLMPGGGDDRHGGESGKKHSWRDLQIHQPPGLGIPVLEKEALLNQRMVSLLEEDSLLKRKASVGSNP